MTELHIPNLATDRMGTLRLISWWKQESVERAKIMVVGAGALGNEVIKNLTLMGVGHLYIVDRDTIEAANLSRSILFREQDNGKLKALVATQRVKDINPAVKVRARSADVNLDIGLGVFRRMDAIIGCLDNRLARLSVNRSCWKVGKPWVDGAIQELFGEVRVFVPNTGACYECTLTGAELKTLSENHPCNRLALANILLGKVPTTPTISSIIGGVQSQEALKLIHGMTVHAGKAFVFRGLTNDSDVLEMAVNNPYCESHYAYANIVELSDAKAETTTLKQLIEEAEKLVGDGACLYLDREIVTLLNCPNCHHDEAVLRPLQRVTVDDGRCPTCGDIRLPEYCHCITGQETFADRTLAEVGIPPLHIIEARGKHGRVYLELTGDAQDEMNFT